MQKYARNESCQPRVLTLFEQLDLTYLEQNITILYNCRRVIELLAFYSQFPPWSVFSLDKCLLITCSHSSQLGFDCGTY